AAGRGRGGGGAAGPASGGASSGGAVASGGGGGAGGAPSSGGTSGAGGSGEEPASGGSGGGSGDPTCDIGIGDGSEPEVLTLSGNTFAHDPTMIKVGSTYYRYWTGDHIPAADRKSTRLNSSHVKSSYAVFCLKKKTKT